MFFVCSPCFFASNDILSDFYVFFNHNFNIFLNNLIYIQKFVKNRFFLGWFFPRCDFLHSFTIHSCTRFTRQPFSSFLLIQFFCFFYFSPSSRSIFRFIENRVTPSSAAARVRLLPESFNASDIYRFSSAATSCSRSIGPFFRSFR